MDEPMHWRKRLARATIRERLALQQRLRANPPPWDHLAETYHLTPEVVADLQRIEVVFNDFMIRGAMYLLFWHLRILRWLRRPW